MSIPWPFVLAFLTSLFPFCNHDCEASHWYRISYGSWKGTQKQIGVSQRPTLGGHEMEEAFVHLQLLNWLSCFLSPWWQHPFFSLSNSLFQNLIFLWLLEYVFQDLFFPPQHYWDSFMRQYIATWYSFLWIYHVLCSFHCWWKF